MAELTWKYNYDRPSGKQYYYAGPSGAFTNPLTHWAINHLNRTRNDVMTIMLTEREVAHSMLKRLSRVDTGLMRSMAMAVVEEQADVIKLRFGWDEYRPYYAPFQEFGTETIQPMMAVYSSYYAVLGEITEKLGRAAR